MEMFKVNDITGIVGAVISGSILGWTSLPHCLTMCGPLHMSICLLNRENYFKSITIFNLARLLGYSIIGFLIGTAGFYLSTMGDGKMAGSFHSGSYGPLFGNLFPAVLLLVMSYKGFKKKSVPGSSGNAFSKFINSHFKGSNFAFGLAASLLPCGMLYAAIAIAFSLSSPLLSVMFMFSFCITITVPMQLGVMAGNSYKDLLTPRIEKFFPYITLILAIFYIFRLIYSYGK